MLNFGGVKMNLFAGKDSDASANVGLGNCLSAWVGRRTRGLDSNSSP